ncbi:uncharacterized protein TRIADDRAFT_34621 [Trichoplax adhaerens]|uniref:NAD-dependent epimerase/dehydratase domain-containing protein n=1 Tax=Trichoplax adhaerens TaxID=10228 RepID=B3SEQ3_TRIAD|nr:hypothetical protein TRIADDRAFT_34621 [Trichoplax adhaerens]EDV18793.1 hypothetical protein TRIADDRAFT_34621 [Trichoplax adhaerens]|eukprot:XP_002118722.1 hypothetical protein TRIADDRAFT_34621 [Trichoplax adhaerens]
MEDPYETHRSNVMGTLNILEAIRKFRNQVTGAVIASSDKAYGHSTKLPYTENHPLRGLYPYDASKACTDILAQSFAQSYRLPIGVLRCANLYGPHDFHVSRLIPGTILSYLRDEQPVIRSDGSYRRDYLYIDDAVDAYLKFMDSIEKKQKKVIALNIGTDRAYSVQEVVRLIAELMNKPFKPTLLNNCKGEIHSQFLNSMQAKHSINWCAKTILEEGLMKTIESYQQTEKVSACVY